MKDAADAMAAELLHGGKAPLGNVILLFAAVVLSEMSTFTFTFAFATLKTQTHLNRIQRLIC